jgi:hypothetical protein
VGASPGLVAMVNLLFWRRTAPPVFSFSSVGSARKVAFFLGSPYFC